MGNHDTTQPRAAIMPREYLELTVREMAVGEVRRIPHWAIKLDADGRCFVLTDRLAYPLDAEIERGVTIERSEAGFRVTMPADARWLRGGLEDLQRDGEALADAEPVVGLSFRPAAPAPGVEAATAVLDATPGRATYIRIGFDTTLDAADFGAYRPYLATVEAFDTYFANSVPDMGLVRTVVRTRDGSLFASTLTMREIDTRIRKAGRTII